MITYFIRRLLWLVPVLFFVAFVTFALMHATPGGPWDRDPNARQVDKTTQETTESAVWFGQAALFQSERRQSV